MRNIIKFILLIVAVAFMCSCKTQSIQSYPSGDYDRISKDEYKEFISEDEGAIITNYVNDSSTAIAIADAVIKSIVGEEKFEKLIGVTIGYYEKDGVWIVNRNLGPTTLGGDYTCVIRRNNGEILMVKAGE